MDHLKQAERLTDFDQWFRYWMPYQFVKLHDAKHQHTYLPVNRNYKPLGVTTKDWIEYNKFEAQAVVFGRDPATFKDIWWDADGLYLYEDDPGSRVSYFERLGRLFLHTCRLADRAGVVGS